MSKLRFTKEHEWAQLDGDTAICGITDFAQKALGDIVYVEVPPVGKKAVRGKEIAVIESAKAASEIYAPLDGEVTASNQNLSADPAKVNQSPQSDGWIFKLKPLDPKQIDTLMDETAYQKYLKEIS